MVFRCFFCLLLALAAAAQQPLRVPAGEFIMMDGNLDATEWKDAARMPLGDFARLYVKQTDGYVWLAVELLKSDTGTLDLYLSPGENKVYNLHASAKLGERFLTTGVWPEEWHWWNNTGWVANVSRVDAWDKRTFMPEKVREYQISRARFPGSEWRVMLEIMTPAKPSWQTTAFPAGANNTDPKDWIRLRLD
ncbi:MAG TPA: hypothetical protein VN622_08235 [Clostridia bacterium]|nr:hypothetical protein [Clostridia bacterium]